MVPPIKTKSGTLWIGIFLLVACSLQPAAVFAEQEESIRVALLQDASSFALRIKGAYEIEDSKTARILRRGRNLNTTVTADSDGILLGDFRASSGHLLLKAEGSSSLTVNGRRFKEKIGILRQGNGRLLVTNVVNLEDYVKGILYHETSHYWPQDALMAQAIVCRSYALYQKEENRLKDFDLTSDVYSQVYGGLTSERQRTSAAVEETKGEILTFQGKVFPAFFSATCGGHTEDASVLWKIDLPPLKGVPCSFCQESPHYNWHYVLSRQELLKKIIGAGYKLEQVVAITPLERDPSGRVTGLRISSFLSQINISAKDFRNLVGPNLVRSTNFEVRLAHNDVVFQGVGWGHGVGMCQWGAYFMAKSGHTYIDILRHYYPGTEVVSLPAY
jgi:stage II sporulation protein D